MKSDLLRERFLIFFESKKHRVVESDSLLPKDDPTVLFTPAGMNQFKQQFLGHSTGFTRAASSQRCLRTDDLDKVGKTRGHHTFFEMLGNFSFGDYFKKEAIAYAWEFLTKVLGIPEEKLWVSVYTEDEEAYTLWRESIGISKERLVKLGDKENFWPSDAKRKGPNGPCGPCSEIFFDQGKSAGCGKSDCTPACDCGRFLEVWNLVFTQFNRNQDGTLEPLPQKNIDTGMGLERLAAVMQGVKSNFETDLFVPLNKEIVSIAAGTPKMQLVYAISDHIRAIVFSIYDGVLPSNEGRGYVVRKLIRKSILHLGQLGYHKPFLYKLVPILAEIMKAPYPELKERREEFSQVILSEEQNFSATLGTSERLFREALFSAHDAEDNAHKAFVLHDTYGIPLELTEEWLKNKGMVFSLATFEKDLKVQKDRSKLQSTMKGDVFSVKGLHWGTKKTLFQGYAKSETKAKIIRLLKENKPVKKIEEQEEATLVLDKTVFYGESGGQVGDTGVITKGKNQFAVLGTMRLENIIVHVGKVLKGSFKVEDEVTACVDYERRLAIARNHTATHLLQASLRKVLGAHVKQQGSLVAENRLRFDFTHSQALTKEELDRIEEEVNNQIIADRVLTKKEMSLSEAKKTGALAFFQEKYADKVRVVTIADISKELCAGTHLETTGQIGIFKITQEGSVASGTRRIEAACGIHAYRLFKDESTTLAEVVALLKVPAEKAPQELEKRLLRIKELEKSQSAQKIDSLKTNVDSFIQSAESINQIKVITAILNEVDMNLLRKNVDLIKQKTQQSIIALGAKCQGKALLVVGVTQDLCEKGLDASEIIRHISQIIGGSGGGRKDFAQSGGSTPENLTHAFDALKKYIKDKVQ
ncbi:MAG: alanine--tRNA ligase [Candidatus Omnitrophica bacterium]|nr:alanine--tRNA ligase [Candidatus Omnitrophota bacterium]